MNSQQPGMPGSIPEVKYAFLIAGANSSRWAAFLPRDAPAAASYSLSFSQG